LFKGYIVKAEGSPVIMHHRVQFPDERTKKIVWRSRGFLPSPGSTPFKRPPSKWHHTYDCNPKRKYRVCL